MRSKALSSPARRASGKRFQRRGSRVIARSLRGFASFSSFASHSAVVTTNKGEFARLVFIYLIVLLTQWVLLTYLQPFFPQFATTLGISDQVTGVIFACYPVGASTSSMTFCRYVGLDGHFVKHMHNIYISLRYPGLRTSMHCKYSLASNYNMAKRCCSDHGPACGTFHSTPWN